MNKLQSNNFYKYKGDSDNYFKQGDVYKVIWNSSDWYPPRYLFENKFGERLETSNNINHLFTKSGIKEDNWEV